MDNMTKEILSQLREQFKKEVSTKNSWGKNEVLVMYDKVVADVLISRLGK